jgi:hypothetical protein
LYKGLGRLFIFLISVFTEDRRGRASYDDEFSCPSPFLNGPVTITWHGSVSNLNDLTKEVALPLVYLA